MHDLRRTSLSPIEPADKRASRAIAHSIIRPRENKVSRLGTGRETGTVYSRHRAQVRLANAISGPGTARPVCKVVREPSSFWSFNTDRTRRRGRRRKDSRCETITIVHFFSLLRPDCATIIKLDAIVFEDFIFKEYNMQHIITICSLII